MIRPGCLCVVLCLASATTASAQLSSEIVVSGFSFPVAVVQDPTQSNVQFVVEQGGRIRVVRDGQIEPADFINLTPLVLSGGERGLLGLAFAPDYVSSRRFFVNYTRQPDGHTVISRYLRSATNSLQADPSTRFDLRWPTGDAFIFQPFSNHNAGDLQFGSDELLYVPLGDGGGTNDPGHRAQNPGELLGKMLRIDVRVSESDFEGYDIPPGNPFAGSPGFLPEIWAFGLRNPFRVTVDAIARGGNGAIVIADVGQFAWEEVDYEPFGAGGRNYGWRLREGAHDNVTTLPPAFTPLIDPITEYSRADGNVITGGVVYRGTGLGVGFWGRYFFADFGSQRMWSVGLNIDPVTREATAGPRIEHTAALGGSAPIGNVSSFGIGADCEILFVNYFEGQLRRIVNPGSGAPPGCPTTADPFLNSGGGVFVNGTWVMRDHPSAAGAGLAGVGTGTGPGCTTPQPASDWVCVGHDWLPPGFPGTGDSTPPPPPPPPPPADTSSCPSLKPGSDWVCVSGDWVPPNHPRAQSGATPVSPAPPPPPPPPSGGANSCSTPQPASDWVCVGHDWVPFGHPLASTVQPAPPPPASSGGCTTPDPFVGIPGLVGVCVNGQWVPSGHPLAGGR